MGARNATTRYYCAVPIAEDPVQPLAPPLLPLAPARGVAVLRYVGSAEACRSCAARGLKLPSWIEHDVRALTD